MATTTSVSTGYTPVFYMPVIDRPPTGTDPAVYYNNVGASSGLTVTETDTSGLRIRLSDNSYSTLYAISGGTVCYFPPGMVLPVSGGEVSTGAGTLMLFTWAVDFDVLKKKLSPGVPPMASIIYMNVESLSVRNALAPFISKLPIGELQDAWDLPSCIEERPVLEENYLDKVLQGEKTVFVPGGTPIGEAGSDDLGSGDASSSEFTLRFLDSAGDNLTPVLHLQSMPDYGGEHWKGHPLINALSNIEVPINLHVKFEIWENEQNFVPLPAGITVELKSKGLVMDPVLARADTDVNGYVRFSFSGISELQGAGANENSFYFLIKTNGITHAGHTLPESWSTKGWLAVDGSPGYYEHFNGTQIGDSLNPVIFRVGVDYHARFEYVDQSIYTSIPANRIRTAPRGIPVTIMADGDEIETKETDSNGEIHGIIFDVKGGDTIHYRLDFEIKDESIKLPVGKVDLDSWETNVLDVDQRYYPNNDQTSLGTKNGPEIFKCTTNNRNVALYILKQLRELSTFLYYMTGGAWTGVEDLTIYLTLLPPAQLPYSWPYGTVRLSAGYYWDRSTIIHEISHQIMWKEVNYSSLGIAYEALLGNYSMYHNHDLLANPQHALIEGWPEFLEAVFTHTSTSPPYSVNSLSDSDGNSHPLGPPPNNRGESVEGAVANGLWAVFTQVIVNIPGISVYESPNGDIVVNNNWLTNTVIRDKFLSIIWQPLCSLKDLSRPTSRDLFKSMHEYNQWNPTLWPQIQQELRQFNMVMENSVAIYVKFEVKDVVTNTYKPLPDGVVVELMDFDLIDDDVLASRNTDVNGQVTFAFLDLQSMLDINSDGKGDNPDIYFVVKTNEMEYGGQVLPDEWSSKGKTAVDGSPGFYENYNGSQIGVRNNPLIFRIE